MYDYSGLPEGLQGGMQLYVEKGISTGGFLTACLENNLIGAVEKADDKNRFLLPSIVSWLTWEVPSDCWGSKDKVASWHGMEAHECEEFISVCCGAYAVGETDFCGKCQDHTGFECEECGKAQDVS